MQRLKTLPQKNKALYPVSDLIPLTVSHTASDLNGSKHWGRKAFQNKTR